MAYPFERSARDRFVLARRPRRLDANPWGAPAVVVEPELTATGDLLDVATLFLIGRECPWRCVMCDLWQHTTVRDTPLGAIPAQVRTGLASLPSVPRVIKLYNAGSFFDPRAVPDDDYDGIAAALSGIEHVIVESHPALIGPRLDLWLSALDSAFSGAPPRLETAIGLETAHPDALERINKRITVAQFESAAHALRSRGVGLRVFLLIAPPFVPPAEQDIWLRRSVDAAFDCGATAVSLIPTRSGNGAMEALAAAGQFVPPTLEAVEAAFDASLAGARGRVFLDLWDIERFAACECCGPSRIDRLRRMNATQEPLPSAACAQCVRLDGMGASIGRRS